MSEYAFKKLSDEWKQKMSDPALTIETLKDYINQFVKAAKDDQVEVRGWPKTAYGMSKVYSSS